MIRVFMIDSTEGSLYYNTVTGSDSSSVVDIESSSDRAISRLGMKSYDLIILSRGTGRADLFDVAESVKHSRSNKKAIIFILEDNPTLATRVQGLLKGRRVYHYKSSQMKELSDMLERMSA